MKEIHKAKMTPSMVMVTDSNGYPAPSSRITEAELNTLNNYDGKGYIFSRLGALESRSMSPDYSNVKTISNEYTAETNGYVYAYSSNFESSASITINGVFTATMSSADNVNTHVFLPIAKGDVITFNAATCVFIPVK